MSVNQSHASHDPAFVHKTLSTSAKRWLGGSLGVKLVAFILGLLSLLAHMPAEAIAMAVAILTIAAELAGYKSDSLKGDASLLRRRLDFLDALGWSISSPEYSDLLVRRDSLLVGRTNASMAEKYFTSTLAQGPARAVENTMESAWWSKHLSQKMTTICLCLTFLALAVSLVVLFVGLWGAQDAEARILVSRVATSLLSFVLSFGMIKLTMSYWQFSQKAAKSEQAALNMLNRTSTIEAVKLMQEYDLVRAVGPMIPDWLWVRYRPAFNQLWEELRAQRGATVQPSSAILAIDHVLGSVAAMAPASQEDLITSEEQATSELQPTTGVHPHRS
jgi:hypothetical protein